MMAHFQETIEQGGEINLPKDLSSRVAEFKFTDYTNSDHGETEDKGAKIVFRSLGVDRKSKTPYSDATQVGDKFISCVVLRHGNRWLVCYV